MRNYNVIIPAAGQGKRMGTGVNKQFLELNGEPLIIHTVRFFEKDEACVGIVLVAQKEECEMMKKIIEQYKLTKVRAILEGGAERQNSVYNGLKHFTDEEQIVLVHDGARPFLTTELTTSLVSKAVETGAATTAVRVKDTIKRVKDRKVIDTLKRDELWSIQTPQAFKLQVLKSAHQKAEKEDLMGTDDAGLVEWLGHDVHITEGDYQNIKITTPDDLLFAEVIMRERKRKEI